MGAHGGVSGYQGASTFDVRSAAEPLAPGPPTSPPALSSMHYPQKATAVRFSSSPDCGPCMVDSAGCSRQPNLAFTGCCAGLVPPAV